MWELESAAPPADPEARQIQITLAQSKPRYVSPDLDFAVWTATIGESREGEPVTVTGPLGHVTAGEQLVCTGAFSQHPRYGWQFSVETLRSALPQSPEGIALWLMTRVPGIGPTFAGAIVDHFGAEQVFAELDRRPERLREVRTKAGRAISRKSVERAIAAWREVATIREVETFLFTHGISAGLAARLVRRYGDEVVAVLTHEPYRLVELPRVGFKIADGIARSLGVELDDPQRLRAGVRSPPLPRSSSRASGSIASSSGRWSVASLRLSASGPARRRSSSSRSRTDRRSQSRTNSGRSSSSCARDRSCSSPDFPAPERRTRSARWSRSAGARADASCCVRLRGKLRGACVT